MLSNIRWRLAFVFVIGIAIGAVALWGYYNEQGIRPYIVEGYSTGSNSEGTALGVSTEPGGEGESYAIGGARWREFDGPWHDSGAPPSLAQPNTGQRVRLGVVKIAPAYQAPGGPIVVWIEVLGQ